MNIERRLAEISARKLEIRSMLESAENVEMDTVEAELRSLENEETELKRRMDMANAINTGEVSARAVANPFAQVEVNPEEENAKNYRSAFFKRLQGRELSETEKRAINAAAVPGALPDETLNQVIAKMRLYAPLLGEITLMRIAGNVSLVVEGNNADAAIHTENADLTSASDTTVNVKLGGYEIVKLVTISKTVKTMSISAFEGFIVDQLSKKVASLCENYAVNGNGTNQPTGIAYANTWVDDTNGIAWAGASLANADLLDTIALLNGGYDSNAKFLMSKKTLWKNCMPLRDDAKAPIVRSEGMGKTFYIHGYEVVQCDKVSDGVIYFGDLKYLYANLAQDITVESSEESGFRSNSIDYKGTAIFDCKPALGEAFVKCAASL